MRRTVNTIEQICNEIIFANSCLLHGFHYPSCPEELYLDLVFEKGNEELNRGLAYDRAKSQYLSPRGTLLNGSHELKGKHFLFAFNEQLSKATLTAYDTVEELTAAFCQDDELFHPGTDILVPMINGKAVIFSIYYTDAGTGREEKLDLVRFLREHYVSPANMLQRRVVWGND